MTQKLQIGIRLSSPLFTPSDSIGFVDDVDVAGTRISRVTQLVDTTEETVNILDAGPGGTLFLRNSGTTVITIHPQGAAAQAIIVLQPGRSAVFPLHATNVPYATATGSAGTLTVIALPI